MMNRFCTSILTFLICVPVFSTVPDKPDQVIPEVAARKKLSDFNRRSRFPFGFNVCAFGPVGGLALTADYFITPKVALELGGGFRDFNFNQAFTLGMRYHVFGKTLVNLTPYVGLYTVFHHNGSDLQNNGLYIPAGIHKIKKNGFSWSVEIAWQKNTFFSSDIACGFRIGYRFKTQRAN